MGKNLARQFELNSIYDVTYFFEKMGWGKLELVKEKKKLLTFTLLADSVVHRLKAPIETEFRLEAGFLSESIQIGRASCRERVANSLVKEERKGRQKVQRVT